MRKMKLIALLSVLMFAAGCAADPALYRVEVETVDAPGFSGGYSKVEAVRDRNGWSVKRSNGARSSIRRLSPVDGARLDAALTSSTLYNPPANIDGDCLDPDLVTLNVTSRGVSRHLAFECRRYPGMEAVFAVLFD